MSAAAWAAAVARSPSALVTTTTSASSMIPRLMPWRSSPPVGEASSTNRSVRSATATSLWPDADRLDQHHVEAGGLAQQQRLAGAAGHPAQLAPDGEGRTNAAGSRASSSIRVLSPRIEPPERELVGSTASTATRWPGAVRWRPKASMKVDLPTPGGPLMPRRTAPPVRASDRSTRPVGLLAVVGPAGLHQGDAPGQGPTVAGLDARRPGRRWGRGRGRHPQRVGR